MTDTDANTFILASQLMTELSGVVPTLGGHKVTVAFSGDQAFCDPSLSFVNIPALPPVSEIPLKVARQIRGFAAHEAAHIAFTDPTVDIAFLNGKKDPLLHTTWNCVEDYMIEMYWLSIYPGAQKNFAATEIWCCERYMESLTKDPNIVYDARKVGPLALTWMRAIYFKLNTQISRDCMDTLPDDLRKRVENWFRSLVVPVGTTQECLEAAYVIYDDIMANPLSIHTPQDVVQQMMAPGQQGQGQQGQGQQGQGQGQQGQGQGQQGQGQQGQGQQGQGQGHQGQNQGQKGQGQSNQTAGASGGHNQPGAQYGAPVPASALKPVAALPVGFDMNAALAQAHIKPKGVTINPHVSHTSTRKEGTIKDILSRKTGKTKSQELLKTLSSAVSKTSSELRRSLKTRTRDRWKSGKLDGVVDSKRLTAALSGSLEYHAKRVRGESIDTAVSILIDCSGSMNPKRMLCCQSMGIILEKAFLGTKIKHEILGFTSTQSDGKIPDHLLAAQKAHMAKGKQLSIDQSSLYVFRSFDDSMDLAIQSLGNMDQAPRGGTPTAPAILAAHDRLAKRKERRHVLIVLTDGSSSDSAATLASCKAVEKCGVTVLGIGIQSGAVQNEFTKHARIDDPSDLPQLMVSTLSSIILGEKTKKGMNARQVQAQRAKS